MVWVCLLCDEHLLLMEHNFCMVYISPSLSTRDVENEDSEIL